MYGAGAFSLYYSETIGYLASMLLSNYWSSTWQVFLLPSSYFPSIFPSRILMALVTFCLLTLMFGEKLFVWFTRIYYSKHELTLARG